MNVANTIRRNLPMICVQRSEPGVGLTLVKRELNRPKDIRALGHGESVRLTRDTGAEREHGLSAEGHKTPAGRPVVIGNKWLDKECVSTLLKSTPIK